MKYNPSLDGLRGLAITSVVAYHARESLCPGGWMGVDAFFVLSGFLISTILLQEFAVFGAIDLRRFYIRRALRLFPALGCLLLIVLLASLISKPYRIEHLEDILLSASYLMNWNRAFGWVPGGGGFLGHTWSLSMEEQFYFIWPIALLLLVRARRLGITVVSILLILITFWRLDLVYSGASPERTYNGFDVHSDSLLIGCLLALMEIKPTVRVFAKNFIIIPIGLTLAMLATLHFHTKVGQGVGITLAGLCSAWIIIAAMEHGVFRRILTIKPLVYTGRISYGWYLWHYPFIQLDTHIFPGHMIFGHMFPKSIEKASLVLASYLAAAASYHIIELPLLKLKKRFEPQDTRSRQPLFAESPGAGGRS